MKELTTTRIGLIAVTTPNFQTTSQMTISQTNLPTGDMNNVRSGDHEQNDNWEWSDSFTEFIRNEMTGRSLKICPGLRPIADVNLDIKPLSDIAESEDAEFTVEPITESTGDNQLSKIRDTITATSDEETIYGHITGTSPEHDELYNGYACRGDMFDLPFEDNSFDTVISDPPWLDLSSNEREDMFKEVVRVTTPDGKILYNATWIPNDKHTRQFELRFRQQKQFWGGPSFAAFYRRTARDVAELFDSHEYTSINRYPENSTFWSEDFHPNAVSPKHNTDPEIVSSHPTHASKCCPKCRENDLHQVRSPRFETAGQYNLYECRSCGFRPTKQEIVNTPEEESM